MKMTPEERELLLPALIGIATEAGRRIMDVYRQEFTVTRKDDDSPLTAADRAAHKAITEGLRELSPHLPMVSEEGDIAPFAARRSWGAYWLIDPLDGTREFVKRNDEFTVNIALIEDGRPTVGVVQAPVWDTVYYAAKGVGAFRRDSTGTTPIGTRSLPEHGMVVLASRSHRRPADNALLARLPPHETDSVGSSLKFCRIAEGAADFYPRLGPTSEWDTAAAQCIVETAGGGVTDLNLRPLRYNAKESLLNPHFVVFGDGSHPWRQYLDGLHAEGV